MKGNKNIEEKKKTKKTNKIIQIFTEGFCHSIYRRCRAAPALLQYSCRFISSCFNLRI
jgi:hypothetical protein